ncbi:unnamed protein product [Lymnaea stagnalis]|uniref:Uncharacterized protein n=1 Tax=Lymnaea stagnalis TaxID=6523 RepID=A0AAV2ICD2_LYMST
MYLSLSLRSECFTGHKSADSVLNCKKINDTEFHITVLTKALSKYSGARVKGSSDSYDPDGKSIQLPHSYEPTAAFGTLSINGQSKSSDMFCNETIDKEELNLKFNCSSSAEPCVGEIYVDDSIVGTPIENGALYNGKVQNGEEVTVTIKYAACRLDGKYNTMTCRINASYSEKGDHQDNTSTEKTSTDNTNTDNTSTGTTPIIGKVVGVVSGILTLIVGIGVVYKFTQCFGFIKPKPIIDIEKENSKKTDPEIASADTTLLKTDQNDDDKTTNLSDTTKDKVKPTKD